MSAFFSSIKTIVDNYNHGIDTIQGKTTQKKIVENSAGMLVAVATRKTKTKTNF